MQTVGSFLKEKLVNMGLWIAESDGRFADLPNVFRGLTEVEVTVLAENLSENKSIIIHKDWQALISNVSKLPSVPNLVIAAIQHARGQESMHEKFWRYMVLFESVVNSNHE